MSQPTIPTKSSIGLTGQQGGGSQAGGSGSSGSGSGSSGQSGASGLSGTNAQPSSIALVASGGNQAPGAAAGAERRYRPQPINSNSKAILPQERR